MIFYYVLSFLYIGMDFDVASNIMTIT